METKKHEQKQPVINYSEESDELYFFEIMSFLKDTKKIDIKLIDRIELWHDILFVKFTKNDNKKGQTFISYKILTGGKPYELIKRKKEHINSKSIYILYRPVKGKKIKEADISASKTEIEELKEKLTKEFQNKGFHSWVKKLKVVKYDLTNPRDREGAILLANELQKRANMIDMMSLGGTFRGDKQVLAGLTQNALQRWVDVVRKKIKENSNFS